MSLDSFFGLDQSEGAISAEKVREFQDRMARNKAAMAAARQQEQRQKKTEDKLFQILLKFIQNNKRVDLTLLISRCLEQNIPAAFILAIILLGNEDIQAETGIRFELIPGGAAPFGEVQAQEASVQLSDLEDPEMRGALVVFGQDRSFPLKMRIAVDLWSKNIFDTASPIPERILKTGTEFNEDPKAIPQPKEVLNQLTAFILRDYFEQNQFRPPYDNVKGFAEFFMKGVFKRLQEQLTDQKQLGGE